MTNALVNEDATVIQPLADGDLESVTLDGIQRRGTIRVGFVEPRLPFVFRNGNKALVGFDVELAHLLARDLRVRAEFIEWRPAELAAAVAAGRSDIGIGGHALTPSGAPHSRFSAPYLDETAAFVVKDHLRSRFESWSAIQGAADLAIGVPAVPYYERLLNARLPGLTMKTFAIDQDPLDDGAGFDAVALPAERGSVLTLLNPKWTVVVPSPGVIKVPLAFPLPDHDPAWPLFVNTWIEMKRRDGTLNTLYDHWILGKTAEKPEPRWSVARNVLHWVD
jgi:ABC-type amino acid transport substrate-binding protein